MSEVQNFLLTGGGKIRCLRCTATSTRTKQQCGRPALKASRAQKCQFHGGRPHSEKAIKLISQAKTLHGRTSKISKKKHIHDSALMHELEDALYVLKMAEGPRTRGRKPAGYSGVRTEEDVVRMIHERFLHLM